MTWFKRSVPRAPRRVRVHWTKSDGAELAMDGFLTGLVDDGIEKYYVLRRASLVTGALDIEPLEGTVEIPTHRVEFVQDLT